MKPWISIQEIKEKRLSCNEGKREDGFPRPHSEEDTLLQEYMRLLGDIAERFGDGTIHITNRQGVEIPNIPFEKMEAVNVKLQPIIDGLEINQEKKDGGYPAAGTRNVVGCIGNKVCPYANYNTTRVCQEDGRCHLSQQPAFQDCFHRLFQRLCQGENA